MTPRLNRVEEALYGVVLENTATDGVVTEQQGQKVADFARRLYDLAADRRPRGSTSGASPSTGTTSPARSPPPSSTATSARPTRPRRSRTRSSRSSRRTAAGSTARMPATVGVADLAGGE